jgi:two-component system OmpR family response regulator
VVDGEHDHARALAEALRREGWEVSIAGSGAAAVALARQLRPDDVVLDAEVTGSCRIEEVVARLRGLAQPGGTALAEPKSQLHVGDLVLDEDSRVVSRGGEVISLTSTEFELLSYLMLNPRRVLSKAQILDRVWTDKFGVQPNVVELYISYLRKKIDAGRAPMIHTMRGAGYVLRPAS